jgi:23S rRNA pseudouridine1911/1915/1917 synthase
MTAAASRRVLTVTAAAAGLRLDSFVAGADLGVSRSQVRHLIDDGRITVDGRVRKAGQLVRAGDQVEVEIPSVTPSSAEPEALPLTVLHEDATMIAINKAAGMVVHPAPGRWQGTLVNALLHRWGELPGHEASRPGIVHRLDRDTSGVMVIARTTAALEHLGRQFAARTVQKRYLAVVRGVLKQDALVIDAPIGSHAGGPAGGHSHPGARALRPRDPRRGCAGDGTDASDPCPSRGPRSPHHRRRRVRQPACARDRPDPPSRAARGHARGRASGVGHPRDVSRRALARHDRVAERPTGFTG